MCKARVARCVLAAFGKVALSLLIVGLATTLLVHFAPGFGADERQLDPRWSNESIDRLKEQTGRRGVLTSYYSFLVKAASGDLGFSTSLNRPVSELIGQRYLTTVKVLVSGWLFGWLPALLLAATGVILQTRLVSFAGTVGGATVLCVPSAFLAYLCYIARAPAFLVVGLVIFARVFRVLDNLFRSTQDTTCVLAARSQGLRESRIFVNQILPLTLAEIVALGSSSVSIAMGATIAAEALCDQPGLGQLAWKAALARDLPLLMTLTLMIGGITLLCNRATDTFLQIRSTSG